MAREMCSFMGVAIDIIEDLVAVAWVSGRSISGTTTIPAIATIAVVITMTALVTSDELLELIDERAVLAGVIDLIAAVAAQHGGSTSRLGSQCGGSVPVGAQKGEIRIPERNVLLGDELATEEIVLGKCMKRGEERDFVELLRCLLVRSAGVTRTMRLRSSSMRR